MTIIHFPYYNKVQVSEGNNSQITPNKKGYMTCEEMVKAILEKRRKKEIEDYVEEVLEGMTEIELTGPSAEDLEGKQLTYEVLPEITSTVW